MPMETADCYQTALLWEKVDETEYNEPIVRAPVEILVRWENRQAEALDKDGTTIVLDANVVVQQDIPIGSLMWEGSLNQWYGVGTGSGSAGEATQLYQVMTKRITPDIKNRYLRRTVGLRFFRDTMPEVQ